MGTITNVATVSATNPDPVPGNDTAAEMTLVDGEADLAMTKTCPAAGIAGGVSISYTLWAGDGAWIEWATALELETLGFNIYRSETIEGRRTRVNPRLIISRGAAGGADYRLWDSDAVAGATYYYWLEEIEADYDKAEYGPAVVETTTSRKEEKRLASAIIHEPGIYRIGYDALVASGIAIGGIDSSRLQVRVNGEDVAAFVSAFSGSMGPDDMILFYAPTGSKRMEIHVVPEALRM